MDPSVKPATVRRQFNILNHALRWRRRSGRWEIPRGVLEPIELRKIEQPPIRRLTREAEDRLMAAAVACRNPYMLPAIQLALQTGMRRSELLRCDWRWVDLPGRVITVPRSKSGKPRRIVLASATVDLLRKLDPRAEGAVLPLSENALRLAFERVRRRAGLPDLRFHDLRHEAISRLFEKGLTVPEVQSQSGHATLSQLMRYSHANEERIRALLA